MWKENTSHWINSIAKKFNVQNPYNIVLHSCAPFVLLFANWRTNNTTVSVRGECLSLDTNKFDCKSLMYKILKIQFFIRALRPCSFYSRRVSIFVAPEMGMFILGFLFLSSWSRSLALGPRREKARKQTRYIRWRLAAWKRLWNERSRKSNARGSRANARALPRRCDWHFANESVLLAVHFFRACAMFRHYTNPAMYTVHALCGATSFSKHRINEDEWD